MNSFCISIIFSASIVSVCLTLSFNHHLKSLIILVYSVSFPLSLTQSFDQQHMRGHLCSFLSLSRQISREVLLDPLLHNCLPLTLLNKRMCKKQHKCWRQCENRYHQCSQNIRFIPLMDCHFRVRQNESLINISSDYSPGLFL